MVRSGDSRCGAPKGFALTNFESLGVSKPIVATLFQLGIETPTPIQEHSIPLLLEGRDLIGLAQTGTGKTAAFGLPLIEKLLADERRPDNRTTRTLILAPTRELVNQIAESLKKFIRKSPLRINVVVGGVSINKQQLQLEKGTDILVATPGRLLDLVNRRAITLTAVRYLVLDEADQMLDLGFVHDLRKIAKMVPKKRQTMLFSATMPKAIADLAGEYLVDPVKVEVTPPGKAADKVEQYVHFVAGKNDKTELLRKSLTENPDGRAMVFLRTKHGAEKLMKHLENIGYSVASIHGNKSQGQRERALKAFRDGSVKTLIATDVAARGIDIPAVSHVYNYDLPEVPDAYVHRIGRTARAGRDGIAIAFCAPDEARLLRDIERLMGIDITVASGEAPANMNGGPRRANGNGNNRNRNGGQGREGQGRGEGRGDQNRSEHRGSRQERRPRREGEGSEVRAGGEERRPRPERPTGRNEDFRGQRRGEAAPNLGPDNDLASTSDFRPSAKPQRPAHANGEPSGHHRGNSRHAHGRPARKHGEDRGPQQAQAGEPRRDGNGGNRRGGSGSRNGGGQRRERA
ncbi:DEAD/DEAH box helicase [Rhizobium ruizarguesonis]|uniref:DEAD/DEAH box helicase n=1 Tax=Rhizobium ruizarguesonis TaxID=2081791 RepID=UPI00036476B3|nr:DEAD/DEAH box helicase [Rhizobium ruizarguesonis]MBY5830902.1 DEAD/DEAH box helicase [Rhizobium leguminosarum]QJS30486.1 DEAD/DEAH box helicase [Rhizobium leguminosarum bv. trifolii TA1]MBY5859606.1 DEAD/DEAH box helicase [Rhizobium leguminosarum]MBY5871053.1 DEAD/DEAH box helicase [Rhizobium leguminosarum]NEH63895.1 DEAD/DEAH box helicase [Rhizobium ruizarguesonis]